MEGAAWAECIPFSETRDYVKKVLSNTTMYAALIHNEPQSLKAKLGIIGPRDANAPERKTPNYPEMLVCASWLCCMAHMRA
jgi:soluble lytic murein transglycosylase